MRLRIVHNDQPIGDLLLDALPIAGQRLTLVDLDLKRTAWVVSEVELLAFDRGLGVTPPEFAPHQVAAIVTVDRTV